MPDFIQEYKIGSFLINNKRYLSDIKIVNKRPFYWNDRNRYNLEESNLNDLFKAKPEVIIIGTGASGMLKVSQDIKEMIKERNTGVVVEPTPQAVKSFNKAVKANLNVAAIMAATC
jgi:hypothetical protein